MPWSDGTAVVATSVTLVDDSGNIVGTLDGSNGLVLYGSGGSAKPGMTLTPFGDLFWANFNANGVSGPRIEASDTGLQLLGGTNTGDTQPAAVVVDTHLSAAISGAQVYPLLDGNSQSSGGSPVPSPEVWNALPALQAGWTVSGLYATPSYRCNNDKDVVFQGAITGGTTTDNTLLFTLPPGYRPPSNRAAIAAGGTNGSFFGLLIGTDGTVRCEGIGTKGAFAQLDVARFSLL